MTAPASAFFGTSYLNGFQFTVCLTAASVVLWLEGIRKWAVGRHDPDQVPSGS